MVNPKKYVAASICITLLFFQNSYGQNIDYARQIIDTLTSSHFGGRGAVNGGEKKAADFIVKQYKRMGLTPIGDDFFQPFNYSINTFPGELSVEVDGKILHAGTDYLVLPQSCKIQGEFQLIWYSESNIPTKKELKKLANRRFFENKFVVVDDLNSTTKKEEFETLKLNTVGASGIVLLEETKLTHRISTKLTDYVTLLVMRTALNSFSKTISVKIDQEFLPTYTSQNVIGKVTGVEYPDSIVVISAHYDHLGRMGKDVYFPGANDNASGVAMLLNLAYHYTHKDPPKKTMVFMAFGAEESGLVGSKYFTENPLFPLQHINFLINLDLMGTGIEGVQVVNGSVFQSQFDKLVEINEQEHYLPQIKTRGKAANSDHYWFSEKGVPAFFIYTLGGITAYHDVFDKSETLPLTKFEDCFRLIKDFVDDF
ncbi:MAG: M28 family peptidase [Bacteroidetes bacterium]|nr:M28 family peptidase [Bacteroidota bacterium]